jgi:hypothetical protein
MASRFPNRIFFAAELCTSRPQFCGLEALHTASPKMPAAIGISPIQSLADRATGGAKKNADTMRRLRGL